MTNYLQPGQHLSPDQLSAFAENALPEHERFAALTHLADCPDCRQVVFLTQQADPTLAGAPAESPRRGWLSLPQIFGAATVALACTIILALIIHHQLGQTTSAPPVTTAKVETPSPIVPPAPTTPAPAPEPAPQKAAAALLSSANAQLSTAAPSSLAESRMSAAPQSPPKIVPKQIAPPPPALGGIIAYSGTGTGQTEESKMRATQAYVTGADRSAYAAPTPPAPPTAAAKPESNFSAESANDATTIDTATVESLPLAGRNTTNYAALTPGIVQPIKLPSKKPVASQLAAGNRILALDTAGALFLATDNGKHWRSIAPQWSGKAVQLSFAPSPARLYLAQPSQNQTQNSSNQTNGYINGAAAPPVPQQQTQQTIIPTVGFQLITNTGAVWLSTDGLTWHPR